MDASSLLIIANLAIAVGLTIIYTYRTHRPSDEYIRNREPSPGTWGTLYPADKMILVREALCVITSAFLLKPSDSDRLKPDDKLMDLYRAAYPSTDIPDALEFETLWRNMRKKLEFSEAELQNLTSMTVQDIIELWLEKRRLTTS